jgi:hypothetical protein
MQVALTMRMTLCSEELLQERQTVLLLHVRQGGEH